MIDLLRPRDLDILRLMGEGLTNREIGERLYISGETVKGYAKEIYSKLDVHNRMEAVNRARELGLLDDNPKEKQLVEPISHNLPPQITPFIGRDKELLRLSRLLADKDSRLTTIVGAGGMGKTRLALEMARQTIDSPYVMRRLEGIYFVNLAPLTDPLNIVSTIADSLDLQLQQDNRSLKQQLLDYLQESKLLLLLDNCEHLLDGMDIVADILKTAPDVIILATSRETLGVRGETIFTLRGMPTNQLQSMDEAQKNDAVQLFVQSARRVQSKFTLSEANLSDVNHICELIEGMPLGIEIAATWVRSMTLEEIADELQHSMDILETKAQSLRAVLNRSWRLLTENQRQVFERFSVFRGGATREATEQVTGGDIRTLNELVDKSLLRRTPEGRYEIHELLRQYGEEQLEASGSVEAVRDLHSHTYLTYVSEREAIVNEQGEYEFDSEFENIRVAWIWAIQQQSFDLVYHAAETLAWYCGFVDREDDRESLLILAIESLATHSELETYWSHLVSVQLSLRPRETLKESDDLKRGLAIARQHNNLSDEARYSVIYARIAIAQHHDYRKALDLFKYALSLWQRVEYPGHISFMLHRIGYCYLALGEIDKGIDYTQQSINVWLEMGNATPIPIVLYNLGIAYISKDEYEKGIQYVEKSLTDAGSGAAYIGASLSLIYFLKGEFQQAEDLVIESVQISYKRNIMIAKGQSNIVLGLLANMRNDYQTGLELCNEGLILLEKSNPADIIPAHEGVAIALCGLERIGEAILQLQLNFDAPLPCNTVSSVGIASAVLALYLHSCQEFEQATHYLSFVLDTNYHTFGWAQHWSLLKTLRTDLEQELGQGTFHLAWQQGKQLDLNMVVDALLSVVVEDD
jgi:predicted ATPase